MATAKERAGGQTRMSPEEFSLLAARPEGWGPLLFALALKREIGAVAPLRRRWHDGLNNDPAATFDGAAYREAVERKAWEAEQLSAALRSAWLAALETAAAGTPEPAAVLAAACAVGERYRALLAWKPDVLGIPTPARLAGLRSEFSRMCDGLVLHLEMVAHGHSGRVLAALIVSGDATAVLRLPELDPAPAQRLLGSPIL